MTGVLLRIAEVAGDAAARKVAAEYGGRRLYVPSRLPADHRLCLLVGFEAATAIQREIGPGHVDVPLGPTAMAQAVRRAVSRLSGQGLSTQAIATQLGCSVRTVKRHRSALGQPGGRAGAR